MSNEGILSVLENFKKTELSDFLNYSLFNIQLSFIWGCKRLKLNTPEGGPGFDFTPEKPWNIGKLEKWNVGDQKRKMFRFYFLPLAIHIKI
jgi:hypothetical protein